MTPFERLALVYFVALLLAAPWAPRRRAGMACAAAAAALVILAALALPPIGRAWLAHAYLVLGYWIPAMFAAGTHPRFERWLVDADARLFRVPPGRAIARSALELAYLLCYPLVPAAFVVVLVYGATADVVRFWTGVLAAGYACYISLPWAAARPPRATAARDDAAPHALASLNRAVLGLVSHQRVTFPSGHVAVALVLAVEVTRVAPAAGAAFTVLALLIAVAAVAGRYHYLIDVLAGVLVALVVTMITGRWT
jgi:hypothetical protein